MFIDTETSGLPKDWTQPYSNDANWPHAVQVSWIIYTVDGTEIKREDHYIRDNDFEISAEAFKVHGITRQFLNEHGERREYVLNLLCADLEHYEPMVVGHYIELDQHVTGADLYRINKPNPIDNLPQYCTMLGSKQYARNPQADHLRLGQLYSLLFKKPLNGQHNAMTDALATAECFFEMMRNGNITDAAIEKQRMDRQMRRQPILKRGCGISVLILVILIVILAFWI